MEKLQPLVIGDLVAPVPIVQGGMGIGVSLGNLAGAVAKHGGIGVISAAQIGFMEEDFAKDPLSANLRSLEREIRRAKEISNGGIIGVNIMCAVKYYEHYVQCAAKSGADLIISGAGLPTELPGLVEGYDIKIAPIVAPPKAAKVLLKMWDKKFKKTADMVVIEGALAGGHLGFSDEEIELYKKQGYDKEIREILEIVKGYEEKYDKKIPVIFGGGVFDRSDIDHFISLGCSGVQMGTRFVATEECDAHPLFKQAYVQAKEEDIIIKKSPVGMPGRAIRNQLLRDIEIEKKKITKCYQCLQVCDRANIPYCITTALVNAVRGELDDALIFCGQNAHRIEEITTVEKLMTELAG